MWQKISWVVLVTLLAVGCSAPSQEIVDVLEPVQEQSVAGGAGIVPVLPEPTAVPESYAVVPTAVPEPISYPIEETAMQEDAVEPSGEVNLAALDADAKQPQLESAAPDELQDAMEAPRPGAPNPQIAMESQVVQDLAKQLSVDVSDVMVKEAVATTWNDSSLGCPEPDMMYAQMITDGFWFDLEVNGQSYQYHTDMQTSFKLCEDSQGV